MLKHQLQFYSKPVHVYIREGGRAKGWGGRSGREETGEGGRERGKRQGERKGGRGGREERELP